MKYLWLAFVAAAGFAQTPIPPPPEYVILPVPVGTTPGAFGSLWRNELWIHNSAAYDAHVAPEPCRLTVPNLCSLRIAPGATVQLQRPEFEIVPFTALGITSGLAPLHFNLRTRDLSRSAESAGTEVPVVRANELHSSNIQLLNVPNSGGFRVMLRIFLRAYTARGDFVVRVFDMNQSVPLATRNVHVELPILPAVYTGAGAANVAVADIFAGLPSTTERLRVEIAPIAPVEYWAFISVTNNETQQVTTITPQ